MLNFFSNNPYMWHHAQGFYQSVILRTHDNEEFTFCKQVLHVPPANVPSDSNVIRCHTIYKVRHHDDLSLKARISPHVNKDSRKAYLRTECCMCFSVGVRIVLSVASSRKWMLAKSDIKSALLQIRKARHDICAISIPPCNGTDHFHYWLLLLLTAAYGFINAITKWQDKSDRVLFKLSLQRMSFMSQLFFLIKNQFNLLLAVKIVDDLFMTGKQSKVENFIFNFNHFIFFGRVSRGLIFCDSIVST